MEVSPSSAFWEKGFRLFTLVETKCPQMLTFCLLQAKLVVAHHWKNTESPNFKQCLVYCLVQGSFSKYGIPL